jgi:hypothetical protein
MSLRQLAEAAEEGNATAVRALIAPKKKTHDKLLAIAARAGFNACSRVG